MGKFVVDLSPEHRAKLEKYRAVHGLRSEAEAVRRMIDQDFTAYVPVEEMALVKARVDGEAKATQEFLEEYRVTAARLPKIEGAAEMLEDGRLKRNEPKPKFATRLKGEWKAP